jgi:RNA polymerase sigma factor (sigma-70 family)
MPALRPIDRWFIDEVLPHERRYLGVALRLTANADDARDLVQDAYAKLFTLDGWSAIDSPQSYVIRVIRNLAIERIRRARIVPFQQLVDADALDIADEAPGAFREVAAREEIARVVAAVQSLPERCRTVVLRRRFGNESPREIARSTGQSLSTLEKRLARGMQLLAAALSYDGAIGGKRTQHRHDEADDEDAASG